MKREIHVQLPLPGGDNLWFTVCVAATAEGAAEVVRALLSGGLLLSDQIRLLIVSHP